MQNTGWLQNSDLITIESTFVYLEHRIIWIAICEFHVEGSNELIKKV